MIKDKLDSEHPKFSLYAFHEGFVITILLVILLLFEIAFIITNAHTIYIILNARAYDFDNQWNLNTAIITLCSILIGFAITHVVVSICGVISLYQFSKRVQMIWTTLFLTGLIFWFVVQLGLNIACVILCFQAVIVKVDELGIAIGYPIYAVMTTIAYIPLIAVSIHRIRIINKMSNIPEKSVP
jgi:hypothetical protein